jgi:hypothetical protein
MSSDEITLQTRGIEYIKAACPNLMIISIPNEQAMGTPYVGDKIYALLAKHGLIEELKEHAHKQRMITIQKLKRMGMYVGASDILLFSDKEEFALETKDKAQQSVNQEKFQKHWESLGRKYAIWRTLTELHDILKEWGLNPQFRPPCYTPSTRKQMTCALLHEFYLDTSN